MKYFRVNTHSITGRFGKTFKSGEIVSELNFQPGITPGLINQGLLIETMQDGKPVKTPFATSQIVKIAGSKQRPAPSAPVELSTETSPQVVDSCNVEFGYELLSALPYAYSLFLKGKLLGTVSAVDTEPFYFFSPQHGINPDPRGWDNMRRAWAAKIPNIHIHRPSLDWDNFAPPPLRDHYRNEVFKWDKPTLCICNRINVEWGKGVINYFDIPTLRKLFKTLSKKYKIIYFNIHGRPEFYDGVTPEEINDFDLCREMGVTTIHDLYNEWQSKSSLPHHAVKYSFNTVQLMVMANCRAFITMNGGYSILASYMGGVNIIYSKECREITPHVNSFYRWYHRLGGSRIIHTDTYSGLFSQVNTHLVKQLPTLNVLIRTHNRPNYFAECMRSILSQDYPNIRVIVGYHTDEADLYTTKYPVTPVRYQPASKKIPKHINRYEYGQGFPSNEYLNNLVAEVSDGYILLMDDDDAFTGSDAASKIMQKIIGGKSLVMWRIFAMGRIIPSDATWKQSPVPKDISGISFCFPVSAVRKYKFEPYRLADYRLAKYLTQRLNPAYIDEQFTCMQSGGCNMGRGNDIQAGVAAV
jgi:hypothetical protein